MKKNQIRELMEIAENLLDHRPAMDEWESKFVADMNDRFEKYGDKTFVTEPQAEKIYQIEERYL